MARLTFVSENEGKMPSYVAVRSEKEEAPRQEKKFSKVLDLLGMAFDILTTVFVVGCAMMLSRLVDTFFSRTSWTMLLYAENHSISVA